MKCPQCAHRFAANIHSPAPGGFSAPGVFFIFNLLVAGPLIWAVVNEVWWWAAGLGFIQLIGLGANLTSWVDADEHQTPDGGALGLPCPSCGHISRVRPWSL